MLTVSDIVDFLDEFAPPELAEEWDNVGLLVGRRESSVRKVMTCLTLTPDVAAEAVEQQVQLVVTHHPLLFRAVKRITADNEEGDMLLRLIEAGIAVHSPHTSFDGAEDGINQQLAELLGLTDVRPVRPAEAIKRLGSGRWGKLPKPATLDNFLQSVKECCGATYVEYVGDRRSTVSVVAVACGSAGEFLDDSVRLGCDTFLTGETRFHTALQARSLGVNLILTGHYSSERPAVERLATVISEQFGGLNAFPSREESDPLNVYS